MKQRQKCRNKCIKLKLVITCNEKKKIIVITNFYFILFYFKITISIMDVKTLTRACPFYEVFPVFFCIFIYFKTCYYIVHFFFFTLSLLNVSDVDHFFPSFCFVDEIKMLF